MPKVYFSFPDGKEFPIDNVLAGSIPAEYLDQYTFSYYKSAAEDRIWTGKPSTTSLTGCGPRETYLKATTPWVEDLNKFANMWSGTRRHATLEDDSPNTEILLSGEDVTGIADLLEERPDGKLWLVDYKLVGSYAMRLFKGIEMVDVQSVDEWGTPQFYRSGKKKGQAKTHKEPIINPNKAERKKYIRQLNVYRYMIDAALESRNLPGLEKFYGKKIDALKVFFQLRDGGIKAASMNGLDKNIYLEDIPFVSDEQVQLFIKTRVEMITPCVNAYLANREETVGEVDMPALVANAPEVCDYLDSWEGRKCKEYCAARHWCYKIGDNHWFKETE